MQLIRSLEEIPETCRGGAFALGNFDGLHEGHRAVIGVTLEAGHQLGVPTGVFTFDPPPTVHFLPDRPPNQLMSIRRRAAILAEMGCDSCVAIPFNATIAGMSDEAFVRECLVEKIGIRHISVGFDFRYGKDRRGDVENLADHGRKFGFDVSVIEEISEADDKISSSMIRNFIRDARLADAARVLGDFWVIEAVVEHGEKRGRTIGWPTANCRLHNILAPPHGIYATWVRLADDNKWHPSVANFGRTPTTGLRDPLLEVCIFDWSGDLYGQEIEVAFVEYLRPEEKFETLDALINQMDRDGERARQILANCKPPSWPRLIR